MVNDGKHNSFPEQTKRKGNLLLNNATDGFNLH